MKPGPHIIPRPEHAVMAGRGFTMDADTALRAAAELRGVAELIADGLRDETALPLPFGSSSTNVIRLSLDATLGEESYRLRVDDLQCRYLAAILRAYFTDTRRSGSS